MSESPIRINRLHSVWSNEITSIERVFPDEPNGWLNIKTCKGNVYQTELANKPDPECLIDPWQLCSQIEKLTGLTATIYDGDADQT
jgi:hypothetical protein